MPSTKNKFQNHVLNDESPFIVKESYKNLRTNIQFSFPSGGCKVIGVTSAESGDGKSTTALNVAISFAQINKKVVLIDGDLRLPTIAAKTGIPGTPGLSNYIIGENTFEEVFIPSKEHGIYVIPSGNIPPDATWLLQSDSMKNLIDMIRNKADYIIIDLPPVTAVSDALILSNLVDGYLIVVKHGSTSKKRISEMINAMRFVNAKILGFVDTRNHSKGKGYYKKKKKKYGYENAYGYASADKQINTE